MLIVSPKALQALAALLLERAGLKITPDGYHSLRLALSTRMPVLGVEEPEKVAFRVLDSLGGEISASVGVVICAEQDPEATAQSVLRRADKAMYEAKREGGHGLVIHP